jgi:hypothetical protein
MAHGGQTRSRVPPPEARSARVESAGAMPRHHRQNFGPQDPLKRGAREPLVVMARAYSADEMEKILAKLP